MIAVSGQLGAQGLRPRRWAPPLSAGRRTVAVGEIFGAPSASIIWLYSAGKAGWSASKFDEQLGTWTRAPAHESRRLELSSDQVYSHSSRVVSWPKPVKSHS